MATYNLGQAGIVLMGSYNATTAYVKLNAITHRSGLFICKAPCTGIEPAVTSGWSDYWVLACNGIYNVVLTNSNGTVTATYTLSDGSTKTGSYPATTISVGGVTNPMMAENSVGTANIINGSITIDDLSDNLVAYLNSLAPQPYVAGTTAPSNNKLFWLDTTATTGGLKYYNGSAWVAVPFQYT